MCVTKCVYRLCTCVSLRMFYYRRIYFIQNVQHSARVSSVVVSRAACHVCVPFIISIFIVLCEFQRVQCGVHTIKHAHTQTRSHKEHINFGNIIMVEVGKMDMFVLV